MEFGRMLVGAGALTIVGVALAPAVASAHDASATATCDGLEVSLELYPDDVRTVITVDGQITTHEGDGSWSFPWDPTRDHTWSVEVDGEGAEYDRTFGDVTKACTVPEPEETTTTTTTAPAEVTTTTAAPTTTTTTEVTTTTTSPDVTTTTAPGPTTTEPDAPTTTVRPPAEGSATTSTQPVTTTTQPVTTTSLTEVILPRQETTTTTTVVASSGSGPTGTPGGTLPSTGSGSAPLVAVGAAALLAGSALWAVTRRRSAG